MEKGAYLYPNYHLFEDGLNGPEQLHPIGFQQGALSSFINFSPAVITGLRLEAEIGAGHVERQI